MTGRIPPNFVKQQEEKKNQRRPVPAEKERKR